MNDASVAFIIPTNLVGILGERPQVLLYLLRLSIEQETTLLDVTFDDVANACGYANRSGAWKYICRLERDGIVQRTSRGMLELTLPRIVVAG